MPKAAAKTGLSDVVVLGAGAGAGLAAAYQARRRGLGTVLYEARERAGGLLDDFTVPGAVGNFRFDTAVHLSFASNRRCARCSIERPISPTSRTRSAGTRATG